MFEPHGLRKAIDGGIDNADAGGLASNRDDRQAARLGRRQHSIGMRVIHVDDRGATLRHERFKQPQLGGEVRLESRMIVEVIARDVGERGRGKAQPIEPVLIEAVRRGLDGEMGDALACQRVKRTMQRDRIGRGQRAVSLAARRYDSDRTDARGAMAERGPDLPRERGDRGLAAGAGDRRDGLRLAGKNLGGNQRQSAPRIADTNESHAGRQRRVGPLFGQDGDRAGGDSGGDEFVAVGLVAGDRNKKVAGPDCARVGRNAADVEIGMAGVKFRVGRQNLAKLHGGSKPPPYLLSLSEASIR